MSANERSDVSHASARAEANGAKPVGTCERATASEPRERRGACGVPASERVGGSGGAKPPGHKR